MKRAWIAFQIGFTYAGTIAGAGFASGQEILHFFTFYGSNSFWGILVSTLLFAWLGERMLQFGARTNATTYEELNRYLFGNRMGQLMNVLVGIILFGLTTAMMSGVGSLLSEHFAISFHLGVIGTAFLALFILVRGIRGIMTINSLVVPLMLLFIFLIGLDAWIHGEWTDVIQKESIYRDGFWGISSFLYVAFNLIVSQAILVPLGSDVQDEKVCKMGAWIGAALLGLMMFAENYALQIHFEEVIHWEIPMAYLVYPFGSIVKVTFLLLMWSEIFTTLISNVFGLTTKLQELTSLRPIHWMLLIFVLGYAFSLIGFPTLVKVLYPIFGYCGLVLVIVIMFRRLPPKKGIFIRMKER